MKMDRKQITVHKNGHPANDDYIDLPPNERIALVWELTKEVYALTGKHDVESRLQRNVVNMIRKNDPNDVKKSEDRGKLSLSG